jgi:hypothetical protein
MQIITIVAALINCGNLKNMSDQLYLLLNKQYNVGTCHPVCIYSLRIRHLAGCQAHIKVSNPIAAYALTTETKFNFSELYRKMIKLYY